MYWIICITTVSLHSSVGRQLDANISRLAGLELDERVIHGEVRKGTRTTSGEDNLTEVENIENQEVESGKVYRRG